MLGCRLVDVEPLEVLAGLLLMRDRPFRLTHIDISAAEAAEGYREVAAVLGGGLVDVEPLEVLAGLLLMRDRRVQAHPHRHKRRRGSEGYREVAAVLGVGWSR